MSGSGDWRGRRTFGVREERVPREIKIFGSVVRLGGGLVQGSRGSSNGGKVRRRV